MSSKPMNEAEKIESLYKILSLAEDLKTDADPFVAIDMERVTAIVADKLKILDPEGWLRRS
ncbi:MAG: hypothetical protein V3S39_00790 [Thermodesulfobacteriota bacterium]